MHLPYETKFKQKEDFRVSYRFYSHKEGGRQTIPFQGYRSDFWYENIDHSGIFMIWPEFEDEAGKVILNSAIELPKTGTARMWILMPKMRSYHKTKIHIGLKGFFMEGSRRVADCEVIEIVDLLINPTETIEINGQFYS